MGSTCAEQAPHTLAGGAVLLGTTTFFFTITSHFGHFPLWSFYSYQVVPNCPNNCVVHTLDQVPQHWVLFTSLKPCKHHKKVLQGFKPLWDLGLYELKRHQGSVCRVYTGCTVHNRCVPFKAVAEERRDQFPIVISITHYFTLFTTLFSTPLRLPHES